jgi:hypothetical protein
MFIKVPQILITIETGDSRRSDQRSNLSSSPPGQTSVPRCKDASDKGVPCAGCVNDLDRVCRDKFPPFTHHVDEGTTRTVGNRHKSTDACFYERRGSV